MRALSSKRGKRFIAAGVALPQSAGPPPPSRSPASPAPTPPRSPARRPRQRHAGPEQRLRRPRGSHVLLRRDAHHVVHAGELLRQDLRRQPLPPGPDRRGRPLGRSAGKCVIVTFNPRVDLAKQGSLGEVDGGAVRDTGGQANYFSSAPLTGSTLAPRAGQTTGPDLVSAVGRLSDHTVEYTFDQQVDNDEGRRPRRLHRHRRLAVRHRVQLGRPDAGHRRRLGGYRHEHEGDHPVPGRRAGGHRRALLRAPRAASARCPSTGSAAAAGATRTPRRRRSSLNPPNSVGAGTPTSPVLTSAQQQLDGSSQFVLEYSTDLTGFEATRIIAVRDNGEVEAATSAPADLRLDHEAPGVLPERRGGRP